MLQCVLPTFLCVVTIVPVCLISILLSLLIGLLEWGFLRLRFSLCLKALNRITVKVRRILRSIGGHFYVFLMQTCFSYHFTLWHREGEDSHSHSLSFDLLQKEIFKNAHNVLISNHVLYTDWLYIWNFLVVACEDPSSICLLMKDQLRKVPVFGVSMEFLGFLFLKRNASDIEYIRQKIGLLQEKRLCVVIFPEGTTLDAETLAASSEFAAERGLPQLEHCLQPRVKGLDAILQAERIQGIVDLTLCYQDAEFYAEEGKHEGKAFWQWYDLSSFWMQARRPKEISLCIRYHLRESIPSGCAALGGWLRERFAEKDHFLSNFSAGRGRPRLYKRGIDIPVRTKYAPFFALYCVLVLWVVVRMGIRAFWRG